MNAQRRIAISVMLLLFLSVSFLAPVISVFLNYGTNTGILNTKYINLLLPSIFTTLLAFILFYLRQKYSSNLKSKHSIGMMILITFSFLVISSNPVFKYVKYTGFLCLLILISIWMEPFLNSNLIKSLVKYTSIILTYALLFLGILEPGFIFTQVGKLENLNPFYKKEGFIDFLGLFDTSRIMEGGYLKPDIHSNYLIGDGTIGKININRLGFRSKWELVTPRPEGEFRILLAGDSFTVGYRIDDEYTMGGLIESELKEEKQIIKTYTAGLFEQYSILLWQKKYPKHFDANVLVVGICLGNDLVQTYSKQKSVELNQSFAYHPVNDPYYNQVMDKEHLPQAALDPNASFNYNVWNPATSIRKELRIVELIKLYQPTGIWTMPLPGSIPAWDSMNGFGAFLKNSDVTYKEVFQYFENTLVAIDKNASQSGIKVHFIVYPMRFQQSEGEWNATKNLYGLNTSGFDLESPNRVIANICSKNLLSCLDLLPVFKENGKQILHFPFDQHWNKQGNLLAGKEIAKLIRENYFK